MGSTRRKKEWFDDDSMWHWTRIRNEWILIRKGRAKSFQFHHTVYSGQELRDRLVQAGFTAVKLYGNLDGDDYGPNAPRLIAVARKAGNPKSKKHPTRKSRRSGTPRPHASL